LNPRPVDRKSNALPVAPPRHLNPVIVEDFYAFITRHRQRRHCVFRLSR